MELKRLGLARKPLFTVPNHMLGQFSTELLTLYPGANILVAGKEDFESQNRKKLFSRIATGNWDAVIVTHSGFERIPLSRDTQRRFFEEQLHELEMVKRQHADRQPPAGEGTGTREEAPRSPLPGAGRRPQEGQHADLRGTRRGPAVRGRGALLQEPVLRLQDDAHRRAAADASERAFDMFLKVRHVQSLNGGGGVVFATGTPIANSMAEMFTMQRYLQPDELEETQPASLRLVGGDVRRTGDGDGTFSRWLRATG